MSLASRLSALATRVSVEVKAVRTELSRKVVIPYSVTGTVATGVGAARFYVPVAGTISSVRASVGTAPTGASLIVDVNKNGTTIYGTQANRPTIAVSTNTATGGTASGASVSAGDYLTVDVDQIGSTIAGADLTVQIVIS